MLDKLTNQKTVIILVIARIATGVISMPTTTYSEATNASSSHTVYTQIDSVFSLISTLLMVLIIVIALNALGNISKSQSNDEE